MGCRTTVSGLALIASMYAGGAWAQVESQTQVQPTSTQQQQQQATSGVDDIIVTAQRREERLQSVPVAVTALNSEAMDRYQINSLADAAGAAPNTTIFRNPSSSSSSLIYIRGIGDDSSNILREFPISQYLDGVYVGRNLGALLDLIGYERIEVLRGPQGTLYGRNSTGGAVKLVTRRPNFSDFSAEGDVTVGSFNRQDVRAMINLPISETVAANFSVGSTTHDGYYTDINTGGGLNRLNIQSLRSGLLWNASEKLTVYVTGDYSHDNSGLQVPTQMSGATGAAKDIPLYGDFYRAAPDMPDLNKVDAWGVGVQADYQLAHGTLQSVTAYRGVDFRANYDYGGAPIGADLIRDITQTQFSQELQFASDFSGPLQVIAGLFFYHEEGEGYEGFIFTAGGAPMDYAFEQTSRSYAAYAEGSWSINDWLTATLGARVTHDSKKMTRRNVFDGLTAEDDWTKFTPKIGLRAQLNPNLMFYGSFSQGYKAGIYVPFPGNADAAVTALPPETVDAFEIGMKADWFDGRLRTNIALFNNEYDNLQIGVLTSGGSTGAVSADERARGIELEVTATPIDNLFLQGSFTVLDTEFTRVPTGSASYPALGDQQRFSPHNTFKLLGEYDIPLGNGDEVKLGAVYSWFDDQAQGFPNVANMMPSYNLIDARIAYTPANSRWGLELAGKNLGDTRYWTYQSYLAGYARYYAPGRTWSVRLKFDF